ncbi:penicillin-binding protein 1B [Marinobacterium arenosum]|uniref:penicillin-binding protein 1B n=1 Tax=Marinobacterium arenosum TaxID=2862496 RepID=UPI001C9686FC|nr:penicillin-binding protein 1B [Marinobacterium arenosum]MBY4678299.1 penicillin-binding protein 1B [Marinobacterium arenosum]
MTKKRNARSRKRTPNKPAKRRFLRPILLFFLKLSVVLLVLGSFGLIYLDAQIRDKFEGKRWAVPAKVYARPLELYPGQTLSRDDLKQELKGLGYRFVRHANQAGTVEWASQRVRVQTRGFHFPDGEEPPRDLMLAFGGGQLQSIRNRSGGNLPLVRLEPILIGGIYPQDHEDRDLIRLAEAPEYLTQALIQVEDRDFYQHHGISLKGISRAMWVNLKARRFVQGGSTLTQQLVKNFYLTSERSLARKLLELPMAILLDLHYDKDEILEAYLNEVYLGQSGNRAIHGFGLASQYYFAQPIRELQLHQVALLAGLVKGPSYYDPRRNPARAKRRRDLVLKVLADQGVISQQQMAQAQSQPLGVVKKQGLHKGAYPAYLDLVKRQLRDEYPQEALSSEGLRVFTSLDPLVQHRAATALGRTIGQLEKRHPKQKEQLEGSMVVTDPQTGEVLALIGGRNVRYQGFNRALDMRRPIGSLVKPALYLAALEKGYTLASILDDEPIKLRQPDGSAWQPQNFDRLSHGLVPLHRSLALSYNQSTARLGLDIGTGTVVDMLHRLGVREELNPYPSLFLGAANLAPVDMAQIYQTIAANGFRTPLRAIRMVTDAENRELSRYPYAVEQQVAPETIHLIQYALQEVAREGTARYAYSQLPAELNLAGKTGTSNDQRDSWFAGFAGDRLAVVWLGRDDNGKLPFTGSGGALRVWTELMRLERPQPFYATRPENIEYVWIDDASGLRSAEGCEGARQLPFVIGSAPHEAVACARQLQAFETPLKWFRQWFR